MGSWADTDGLVGMELTQLWAAPSRGADAPDALRLSAGVRHILPWLSKRPQQASTTPPSHYAPRLVSPSRSHPPTLSRHFLHAPPKQLIVPTCASWGDWTKIALVSTVLDAGLEMPMYLLCRLSYSSSEVSRARWGARGLEAHGSTRLGLHPGMLGAMGVWGGRQ